ncbi:glycosyltransferase family 2 protein [Methanobrevibacter filiformis]|uniref:Putative glycosyltransferase EpsH n=1 Tax=Methanobrevibacter filiformis TaxID=55758 RepID=A0A165Z570_9EURY|nr:glycosyltransferase family 2 protein [Methanobrevibacter filiformis]KZX10261.1 putative glycosyltransferase EpsH [Methanobrevibacter filiformis]
MVLYVVKKEKLNPKEIYKMLKVYGEIRKNNLFDEEFYLKKYPQIKNSKLSPLDHFIYHGYKEGKKPNQYFDSKFYLKRYPDVKKSEMNPLIHYTLHGKKEKRQTLPNSTFETILKKKKKMQELETRYKRKVKDLENIININFDEEYYLQRYSDVKKDPVEHYITQGKKEGRYPNKKIESIRFDKKYYLNKYLDVKKAKMDPIEHYLRYGEKEGRYPNQKLENVQFNRRYYLNKHPDVKKAKVDPYAHYLKYGEKEGRYPNKKIESIKFDKKYYLNKYLDVKKAKIDPIEHYLTYGEKENRYPNKKLENIQFNRRYYLNKHPDVKKAKVDPYAHYLKYGEKEGRYPNKKIESIGFNKEYYLSKYKDVKKSKIDPIEHYFIYGESEGRYPNKNAEFNSLEGLLNREKQTNQIINNLKEKINNYSENPSNQSIIELKEKMDNSEKQLKENIEKLQNEIKEYAISLNSIQTKKSEIDSKLENFNEYGIKKEKRSPQLIVSLTSSLKTIYNNHYTLYSLLTQKTKPDELILWLSKEEFPNLEEDIPIKIKNLKKNGLTIKWCEDIGSYKKLIPSLKEYPNDIIVTADDDVLYQKDWLEKLYNEYDGENIIAHSTKRISSNVDGDITPYSEWKPTETNEESILNYFDEECGVLYPPNSLYVYILNSLSMKSSPNNNIFAWTMAVKNDTKIKPVLEGYSKPEYTDILKEVNNSSILLSNKSAKQNLTQYLKEHYPATIEGLKNQTPPKVSVIMPIYNSEKYLEECLDSVINQTLKDIEIICVNDGSTDKSLKILEKYSNKDKRIIIINQKNQGAGESRNKGLLIAKGEYLSFLDSDDFFEADMLKSAYEKAKSADSEIVLFKLCTYDDKTKESIDNNWWIFNSNNIVKKEPFSKYDVEEHFFQLTNPAAHNKLFKHDFIINNRIKFLNLKSSNDVTFTLIAMFKAKKISTINKSFVNYRINTNNSITSERGKYPGSIIKAHEFFIKQCKLNEFFVNNPKLKESYYTSVLGNFRYEYSHCNDETKRLFLKKIESILPIKWRNQLNEL